MNEHRYTIAYRNKTCLHEHLPQVTVYPKKYAHGFCFTVLCCGYTLTDFPISTRLTSLALWQSNDCPSASKATLMNMDEYFMWIHYERLHNNNKAKHNKTVCIFLGINCTSDNRTQTIHPISMSWGSFGNKQSASVMTFTSVYVLIWRLLWNNTHFTPLLIEPI